MANLQIEYEHQRCDAGSKYLCDACFGNRADELGCIHYGRDTQGGKYEHVYGLQCRYAHADTAYKGMTVKNYEIKEVHDPYEMYCEVMTRNQYYKCYKVILDGVCVYGDNTADNGKRG